MDMGRDVARERRLAGPHDHEIRAL